MAESTEFFGAENSQKPMPRIVGLAICVPSITIFFVAIVLGCYAILQVDAHLPKASSTAQSSN